MMKLVRFGMVITAAALAACGDDDNGTDPDDDENEDAATVTATAGAAFSPGTVNIITGGIVTWVFQSVEHNVTFNTVTGAPTNIINSSNTDATRSFPTAGVFPYQCSIHAGMFGTVRVGQ